MKPEPCTSITTEIVNFRRFC
uniref:Uncharacterized protein n=1 Tax=Rhizophora mucronata TaxID=61149 RepID=A0A2P2NUQ6_RHIMU